MRIKMVRLEMDEKEAMAVAGTLYDSAGVTPAGETKQALVSVLGKLVGLGIDPNAP